MKLRAIKLLSVTVFLSLFLMAFAIPLVEAPLILEDSTTVPEQEDIIDIEACSIENTTFVDGESIVYKLYYNWNFIWLPAGEVTFSVNNLGEQYHIKAEGRTYKSYEWFFKVRDYYEAFVDKTSLLPSVAIRDVSEGKYKLYDKVNFDQENGKAVSLRGNSREKAITREYDVDPCMHDILSIIYFTRNLDYDNFEEGQRFPVKIFMDKEVWPLSVEYKGRTERLKVKGNDNFSAIQFSPQVISGGIFDEDAEMNVWVSDDENRIPLLIESPVSVGSVKAVLKSYDGLKYDMKSIVK